MEKYTDKIEAQGVTISTSELNGWAEYKRLLRATKRGDVVKLRHGVYAEPSAMLGTTSHRACPHVTHVTSDRRRSL